MCLAKKDPQPCLCILLNTKNQFPLPEQNPIIFHSGYINGKLNHKKAIQWQSILFIKHHVPHSTHFTQHQLNILQEANIIKKVYNVEYGHYDNNQQFVKEADGTLTVWLEPALY